MQVLENEILGKEITLRILDRGEAFLVYPKDLIRTLGFQKGQKFVPFYNHQGEVLFRPIPVAVEAASAGGE